jgi:hypothetical protein
MATMTVEDFAGQVASVLGDDLVALVLYGSAARGVSVPKRSDVNTLLICRAADDQLFSRLEAPLRAWRRAGQSAPLILTEREWRTSADAFPVEYEDIREAHRVLAGRSPWDGITVRPEHVRRQVEQELMGKLVHVRQAYAALMHDPRQLAAVLVGTAGGFFAMLRAALRLAGTPPPAGPDALIAAAGRTIGFDASALTRLVEHVAGARALKLEAHDRLPLAYLQAMARTAEFVNHMERKAS